MTSPEIPQKAPYVVDETPGKKAWCACGRSSNQPYCDGSHAGTGISPVPFELEEEQRVALCQCKRTGNRPMCDGAHSSL